MGTLISTVGGIELPSKQDVYLCVCTLGRFHVCINGRPVVKKGQGMSKIWQLFKFLLTHRHTPVPDEVVCEMFWPDAPLPMARHALHNVMYRLRKPMEEAGLREPVFLVQDGLYSFNTDLAHWIDVDRFEQLCQEARQVKDQEPAQAMDYLKEALDLYRGGYLAEHFYEDWVKAEQQRLHDMYVEAALSYADLLIDNGDFGRARQACRAALAADPTEERLCERVVAAYLKEGNLAKAKNAYEEFSAVLYRENGIQPSQRLQQLYRDVQAQNGGLPASDLKVITELLDSADISEGPLFCDAESFQRMYQWERKRLFRSQASAHLVKIDMIKAKLAMPTSAELTAAAKTLQSVLERHLRSGDVVARINENQFLLLLSSLDLDSAEPVMRRIKQQYERKYIGQVTLRMDATMIAAQQRSPDRAGASNGTYNHHLKSSSGGSHR